MNHQLSKVSKQHTTQTFKTDASEQQCSTQFFFFKLPTVMLCTNDNEQSTERHNKRTQCKCNNGNQRSTEAPQISDPTAKPAEYKAAS